ncbi:MAG: sensor histidine kinase [Methanobacteriota archaeon]
MFPVPSSAAPELRPRPSTSPEEILGIVRLLPDVLFRCEKRGDGKIYWTFNEGGIAEEFHLTTKEIEGKPLDILFPPEVVARLLPEFEAAFRGESRIFTNELGGRSFRHFPKPVFGPDGRVTAVVGFIADVTDLVRAEERIRHLNEELSQRVHELDQANADLASFSYAVSHDLRQPLAVGRATTELLSKRYGGTLDEPGRAALAKLSASMTGMARLIDDVLRLARAGNDELHREAVDLSVIVRDVADELAASAPDRPAEFEIAAAAPAVADARLLRILVENLLRNAWKYTGGTPETRISFSVSERHGETVYTVRDNGIGFSQDQAPLLFRPFVRLPGAQAFEGTGIGLSTVQRIVARHGGRVWAEGAPGKGAAFHFTLGP